MLFCDILLLKLMVQNCNPIFHLFINNFSPSTTYKCHVILIELIIIDLMNIQKLGRKFNFLFIYLCTTPRFLSQDFEC